MAKKIDALGMSDYYLDFTSLPPDVSLTPEAAGTLKDCDAMTRVKLLTEAAQKPVKRFLQLDYFTTAEETFGCIRDELRGNDTIRLQLRLGTSKTDALKALDEFRDYIETGPAIINDD